MSIPPKTITGLLLAGGRGMRMGGADKGLQMLHGEPLALHVMKRLAPQMGALLISANRNAQRYAELGAPFQATVIADTLPDFPGPLAGMLAGLRAARTPFVMTAACDTPNFPPDLAERLADALVSNHADIATVTTADAEGNTSIHPVFALISTSLADDLEGFLQAGERRVRTWYARHKTVEVAFADERTFYNINSLQELADLQRD
jgi:molybdenum cofactor guanylyltransferase